MTSQGGGQGTRKGNKKQTGQKEGKVREKKKTKNGDQKTKKEKCENDSTKDELRSLYR